MAETMEAVRVFWMSLGLILMMGTSVCDSDADEVVIMKCPGMYCGRSQSNNFSTCGACPRGYRPNEASICQLCNSNPTFYDWLFLGFMAMMTPAFHWFFIDFTNKKKNLLVLHVSALIESIMAAICTLLVTEPLGSFEVRSCEVKRLSDWYSMLYNPNPGYTSTLHCTQEIVYPLYTMVMVYYAFCLVLMMIIRPMLSAKLAHYRGTKSIYAALYFFPILVVIQAVFAGLLYYFFPYIVLAVSVITSAAHFAFFSEQKMGYLLKQTLTNPRNLTILLLHWLLHAYGIIAITEMRDPFFHGPLICLVPFPAIFYFLTVKYTNPDQLE